MTSPDIELVNFTDLSQDEMQIPLQWRNNQATREWMLNKEPIPLKEHLLFLEKLKEDEKNLYFVVKSKSEYLGVIYFNKIQKDEAFIGLYKNPDNQEKHIGSTLVEVCIGYAREKLNVNHLKLEVFRNNKRAINLYRKFDFTQTQEDDNMIYMQYTIKGS